MGTALLILPIALTILCGHILARTKTLSTEGWHGIETLSFRLLIPVVLVKSIAVSKITFQDFGPMILTVSAVLVLAGLGVLMLRVLLSKESLPNPAFTTLFQTTTRWNAFIALAAAESLIGARGLTLIAAAMAVLVPLINIANIVVLASFGTAKVSALGVFTMVAKNPLVQGCVIGIAINVSGLPLPEPVLQTLDLIGRGALGVGLLAVGAGLDPARMLRRSTALWLGIVFRLGLCPALFAALAYGIGLGPTETLAGLLVLAVPAASNGYIVAKQVGGDADLYADILAWQTVLSIALLPMIAILFVV